MIRLIRFLRVVALSSVSSREPGRVSGRRWLSQLLLLGLLLTCLGLLSAEASAEAPLATPVAPTLILEGGPVLGARTPTVGGWFSVGISIENVTDSPVEGELVLKSGEIYNHRDETRAPLSLAARSRVYVELPRAGNTSFRSMKVTAVSDAGVILGELDVSPMTDLSPLLFDLELPSRIAAGVRGKPVYADEKPWGGSHTEPVVAVSGPAVVKGELVLPLRPAGYASATLVLARSETLALLSGARLTALTDWLLAGGALAVVVSRPEDLRGGPLPKLVGAELTRGSVPPELYQTTRFKLPSGSSYGSSSGLLLKPATPEPRTAREFVVYTGGNLRPSPWGASASYGLGEVHVLAFDATRTPAVEDEWVQLKVQDLLRHAWVRQDVLVMPHAMQPLDSRQVDAVRKQLDPNEGTRWTVVLSALLLLLYAALAGPVNFFRAAKAGHPLRAFLHLPLYALGASLCIVLLGVAAKGVAGRARHLSLIESAAGMTRAPITRYRGFYESSTDSLTVHASSREAVLDLAGDSRDTNRKLVVERDGLRLEGIQGGPWQTTVVREDDFVSLAGGVSVIPTAGGAEVVNRLARDLVGVVVKLPGEQARYFPRVADGATVRVADGEPVNTRVGAVTRTTPRSGNLTALGARNFPKRMNSDADDALDAWYALEDSVDDLDWWPADVPVVIGQLDGGEGKSKDSGLSLELDRVLVRVIGWGGAP